MRSSHALRARRFLPAIALAILIAPATAPAQVSSVPDTAQVSSPGATPGPASVRPAAIVLDGDTIAILRAPILGNSPTERARGALKIIESLRPPGMLEPVRIETLSGARSILVGDHLAIYITEGDIDARHGSTVDGTATQAARRLSRALESRAGQWSPAFRGRAIVYDVFVTIVLVGSLWLLTRVRTAILAWLGVKPSTRHRPLLRIGGLELGTHVSAPLARLLQTLIFVIAVSLILMWLMAVLNSFPETRPWVHGLRSFLIRTLQTFGNGIVHAIPGLVTAGFIIVIGHIVTRVASELLTNAERGTIRLPGVHPETAGATRRIVSVLLWMLILVMAYPFLPGAQTDTFKGVSVFAGVLFTLGSAGIVGHMMSGLVLVYSRALRPGDYVRVGEVEGIVKEVGTLATKLSNILDEEFTIPNGVMVTNTIKNFTRLAKERGIPLAATVRIGYDAPWRVVHEMLIAAAARTPGLRQEPAPVVLQRDLSDFAVEYQLMVRFDAPERRYRVLGELNQNIQDVFNERGIQIMTPHFEGQPEGKVFVPKSKWHGDPSGPAAD